MRLSRSSVFAALLVALPTLTASAAALYTEDFSYTAATSLNGQGGWAAHSGAGTNAQTISVTGLTYSGYPGSGIGLAVGPTATSGEDVNHTFTGQTTGAVYATFMVNVASTQTTGDYFFHFFDGAVGSGAFLGRVFAKKDATTTNFAFGVQFGSSGVVYTGFSYVPGTTYLVVLKYTFNGGVNDDQVSLFINPTLGGSEPAATVSHTNPSTSTDATNLDGIAIRQGAAANSASVTLDGIRVSTTWIDATTPVQLQKIKAE